MHTEDKNWTKELLIEELKKRSEENGSLRFSPERDDTSFEDAVYENFGNWRAAFSAAGLHPKTKLINYWSHDEVVRRIQQIADKKEPINTLNLESNYPRLWNAARRLFDTIEKAVEAAGYEYTDIKKRYSWSEDEIKKRICELFDQGQDISQINMLEEDSRLLAAGQKFYGSWRRAVEAAGINYSIVKGRRKELKKIEEELPSERTPIVEGSKKDTSQYQNI
ncbi:MAG TPA: hypothetical protein PLN69_05250 [bacterium]|nr:hypothetical protein [bacterium]